jgi:TPP-dependent indolepyruvate ferredoxin oxidoreductase alpha subunit
VLVAEEGEPVMEEAVKAFAQEAGLTLPIAGKEKVCSPGSTNSIRPWCAG